MSILKMVNERGTNLQRLYEKVDYLTADSKTDRGHLVGSSNCLSRFTVEEMLAVKKLLHKTGGRMWVEVVLSLTPEDAKRPDTTYMSLAKDFVSLFDEYQTLFAVHRDSSIRHLHVMVNTVSVRTGKKFTQSPSGLQRLKQKTNDILLAFGFDIIKIGAAEMLDMGDHSEDESFEYLEVAEPECIYHHDEISVMTQGIQVHDAVPINMDYHVFGESTDVWRDITLNENCSIMPATFCSPSQNTEVVDSGAAAVMPMQSARPTISVDVAPRYSLNVGASSLDDDFLTAVRELGQTTPEQLNAAANMAMALYGAAEAKGYDVNIAVNAAPTVEINLNGAIQIDESKTIIDSDFIIEE